MSARADRADESRPPHLALWPGGEWPVGPKRELRAWIGLAAFAIAVAGLGAGLIAASRTPGAADRAPWLAAMFERGLVVHVVFFFVIWFLAVFGCLLRLARTAAMPGRPTTDQAGTVIVGSAGAACALLVVVALSNAGIASLNNYVPVIIHALFYVGLAAIALALGLAALRLLVDTAPIVRSLDPVTTGIAASGIVFLIALLCIAIAAGFLVGEAPSPSWNEDLFWAGGHILQFMNVGLVITAWQVLGLAAFGELPIGPRWARWMFGFLIATAALGPAILIGFEPFEMRQTAAFTDLQYLLAVPILFALGAVATAFVRAASRDGLRWKEPAFLALALSSAVFSVGTAMGLFADGGDTRTPAHYHGVIAGMQLAFMGVFYSHLLPLIGRPAGRRASRIQLGLFAIGQLTAAIGLFIAAAPRKSAGAGAESLAHLIGFGMNGAGGLLAIAGGALFAWTLGRALLSSPPSRSGTN